MRKIAEALDKPSSLSELLESIAGCVAQTASADHAMVFIRNDVSGALELKASAGKASSIPRNTSLNEGEGLVGMTAAARRTTVVPSGARKHPGYADIQGFPAEEWEAFAGFPMERNGRLVGVIAAVFARKIDPGSAQFEILEAFALLASGALEGAMVSEEAAREAEMISKLSGAVVSGDYIEEILQLIVSMAAEIMESKICSLMLLDEEKGELVIAATQSLSSQYRDKGTVKVGKSVSGVVVRDHKAMTIRDVQSDPRYAYPEIAVREGIRSLLSVPMMVKDRVLGVINLYTAREHDFSAGEVRLLQTVANQAAVAIDNTRLLSEAAKMHEALETRKLVERAKGIVMKEMGLSEDAAFRLLQKRSMDTCRPVKEIARAVILGSGRKGGGKPRGTS